MRVDHDQVKPDLTLTHVFLGFTAFYDASLLDQTTP